MTCKTTIAPRPRDKAGTNTKITDFWSGFDRLKTSRGLFYLAFFEQHVLARDRIVFAEFQLFGLGTRVFLGHVIKPGIGGADQFN